MKSQKTSLKGTDNWYVCQDEKNTFFLPSNEVKIKIFFQYFAKLEKISFFSFSHCFLDCGKALAEG